MLEYCSTVQAEPPDIVAKSRSTKPSLADDPGLSCASQITRTTRRASFNPG